MRTKYNIKHAYTLGEIFIPAINSTYEYPYDWYPYQSNSLVIDRSVFGYFGVVVDSDTDIDEAYLDDDQRCLIQMIFNRYYDEYILEDESDDMTSLSVRNKVKRFCGKLWDIVRMTYHKYSLLLKAYDDEAANLTAKLERITDGNATTRNNDTPQDGGDFDDDDHTSYISQGKIDNTESWDNESMIERLDKIKRLDANTMEDWLDEFKDLFVEGGNYL